MNTWITVEDALAVILDSVESLEIEHVSITESSNRILGESVFSPLDLPPFDNSAMDGFAFANPDDPSLPMKCIGTSAAGIPFDTEIKSGQAIRIMTGAMVPDDCDTIVPVENTSFDEASQTVSFNSPPILGTHIRKKATYLARDAVAIERGTVLDPGFISMLASFGHDRVSVARKPRVSIITTGDELVPVDAQPAKGQIRNSNAHMLEALIENADRKSVV